MELGLAVVQLDIMELLVMLAHPEDMVKDVNLAIVLMEVFVMKPSMVLVIVLALNNTTVQTAKNVPIIFTLRIVHVAIVM
jgi:hypothetical protein